MQENFRGKIKLKFNPVYDYLGSLIRLSRNQDFEKEQEKLEIEQNLEIKKWVERTKKSLNKKNQRLLKFFFANKRSPGSGLLKYIFTLEENYQELTVDDFLHELKNINKNKLLYYLIVNNYNGSKELSPKIIKKWKNKNLYNIVNNNFEVSAEEKWQIIKLFNEINSIKEKLVCFLTDYYHKYYKYEEEKINGFLTKHLEKNKEDLKKAVYKGITEIFSLEYSLINFERVLNTRITYFGEFGDFGYFEKNLFVVGYNYPKYINKVIPSQDNLEQQIHILKALADKTRLKLLNELKNESKYMTELANKFEISNPTVDYHLKKFLQAGLIKIDKSENRIYYKMKKDKITNLINLLERYFDL